MKVIESTPDSLVLLLRPWLLWFFSSAIALMGMVVMLTLAQVSLLVCDRTEGEGLCELTQSTLLRTTTTFVPIDQLRGARVEYSTLPGHPSNVVWLVVDTQTVPLKLFVTVNRQDQQAIALQIQHFLYDPDQPFLRIVNDNRWFAYALGGIFVASGGLVSLLFGKVVCCRFQRSSGQLILERQGLLSRSVQHYPLEAIAAVDLETSAGNSGSTYRICLEMLPDAAQNRPKRLPLTPYYSVDRAAHTALAEQINTFLAQPTPSDGLRRG